MAIEQVVVRLDIRVVAKTTVPEDALTALEEHRPDLFVTSIEMREGEMDGLDVVSCALSRHPELKPIVVSMFSDPERIEAALAVGAVAYVLKTAHPDDLASAIRQAFEHSIYFAGPHMVTPNSNPGPTVGQIGLTRRELEILRLVAEGHSNAHLAKMLWVTEQTVKFHLSNIFRKLSVSNRTEASRWAQVHGLLSSQPISISAA